MSEEITKRRWVPNPNGPNEVYVNNIEASWTLFDVRVVLGQLRPEGLPGNDEFVIEERVAITASWAVMKNAALQLTALVESYEEVNGVIGQLKLAREKVNDDES